ncbi:MAG: retroviral-like aspartic protease family protein [Flavobacteriaceae bacterium]|nr:retroviral-like aspartic protease family protein [Flavobacteriaceae bacterium]MDH3795690.1 retroviral-like aspartic protease family protein [Flavobacteriaceae bacterium]
MVKLKKHLKKKSYLPNKVRLTKTNHLEIKAKLNGVKGVFILDTGASNTCVGIGKEEKFHLEFTDSELKAAGAGATDMETFMSAKNTLAIGSWETKKQKIVLFDLSHVNTALELHNASPVDGIIGADVLIKSKGVIDYKSLHLYVRKKM